MKTAKKPVTRSGALAQPDRAWRHAATSEETDQTRSDQTRLALPIIHSLSPNPLQTPSNAVNVEIVEMH